MPKPYGTNIKASIRSDNAVVPLIIYDGECDFCIASVRWVQKRAQVGAISFHAAPLADYGLTKEQCAKEVVVLHEGKKYGGAFAIENLIEVRGNQVSCYLDLVAS